MHPEDLDKYLYIKKTPTWLVRLIYFVGFLTWLGVAYGYGHFFLFNKVFFILVSPFIGFLIIYHLLSYLITLHYKQFDLKQHQHLLKKFNLKELSSVPGLFPSVDIFLPICGENSEVLHKTFLAVSKLRYPNKKVYVLDDKGNEEHKLLAETIGFIYLSRENKGHMKKAGNLKHGYEKSTGDFVVIFDADFAPHPNFIVELLPYMNDPQVGIVQSPQYFQTDDEVHGRSRLEYGASHAQEDFYRFIQVARSIIGAPICCGSNAIYRRKALDSIGGTVQIEHSEDAYTGFELLQHGWRVKFVPIILAVGLCPADLHSYFHQQHRWASGSLSLMMSKKFWESKITIKQKLCFISGFMYYLSHPVMIILSFQVFVLLFLFQDNLSLWNALPFIPCIVFAFIVVPFFRITKSRGGGFLARNAYLYSYTHATFAAFLRKSVGWQPAGAKRSGISQAFMEQFIFVALYFLVYMALVAFSVGAGSMNIFNINQYSLLFWVFYNIISIGFIFYHLYLIIDDVKKNERIKEELETVFFWRYKYVALYIFIFMIALLSSFSFGFYVMNHSFIF